MSQTAAELEQESEQHRANIAALLDELRSRATPGEIVNQMLGPDAGRELMQMAIHRIRRQIRRNPLPFAVIGVGVAWLLLADALKRQRRIPLHDGLDYEDYPELQDHSHAGILGAPQRAIRHLSETMRAKLTGDEGKKKTAMTDARSNADGGSKSRNDGDDSHDSDVGFAGRTMDKAKSAAERAQQMATGAAQSALQKSGEAFSDAAIRSGKQPLCSWKGQTKWQDEQDMRQAGQARVSANWRANSRCWWREWVSRWAWRSAF